jgi:hypothetical protein
VDRGNCTFFRRVKEGLGLLVLWERWWYEHQFDPVLCWAPIRKAVLRIRGIAPLICRLITGYSSAVIFEVAPAASSERSLVSIWQETVVSRVGVDVVTTGVCVPAGSRTPINWSPKP